MARLAPDLVRGIPLFAELDDKSAARLADEFIERSFEPGQEIASEGEGGLNFFVVESGEGTCTVHGNEVGRSARATRSVRWRSWTRPHGRPRSAPGRRCAATRCRSGASVRS